MPNEERLKRFLQKKTVFGYHVLSSKSFNEIDVFDVITHFTFVGRKQRNAFYVNREPTELSFHVVEICKKTSIYLALIR